LNIYDIAKEAGVAISTVSRVLNHGAVTEATREKVQKVLDKYDYKPNAIARGLVTKTMKTIGVLVVDVRVSHYANTAYVLEQEFNKRGYNVLLCNTGGSMSNNIKYIKMLSERQVDGLVLVGSIFDEIKKEPVVMENLKNMPVVLANGHLDLPNSYSVLVDDLFGIKLSVEHLYEKGHRNIVYVKDLNTASAEIKKEGFQQAMQEKGIYRGEKSIFNTEFGFEGGKKIAHNILESGIEFSAIVFGEDLTAVCAMKEFKKLGLKIPDDIAITGYNNSEYVMVADTELTSVDNKFEMLATLSANLLSGLIDKKENLASLTIQPVLVVRQSS